LTQCVPQRREPNTSTGRDNREDAQPHPLVRHIVEQTCRMFHRTS